MTPQEIKQLNGPIYQEYIGLALTLTKEKELAMDIVQESYYRATKYQHQFREGTNLRRWIKTIVRNVFISEYRKIKRRRELVTDELPTNNWANRTVATNPVVENLVVEYLVGLVRSVPEIYRQSFILLFSGMTYQQISDYLEVPVGTVKSRVLRREKF